MKNLEHQHQAALFTWAANAQRKHPELALLYAIPNGGARNAATGAMLKREGVKAGVPDICLPVPRRGYSALYIELKAPKGTVQANQKEWIDKLNAAGCSAVVCKGWERAKAVIEAYLTGPATI